MLNKIDSSIEDSEGSNSSIMSESSPIEKKIWTREEDKKLADLYNELKDKFEFKIIWIKIAASFPDRSREQCRKRWRYKLDPGKKHDKWAPHEDEMLWKLHCKIGNKWAKIGKLINRSDVEIKNRYFPVPL